MTETPIYQVDAFSSQPFRGNPAGVCLLSAPQPDLWMQKVSMEMNLAETAFLLPEGEGYRLRWFTPTVEVDLCGHATLAAAHILWETGREKLSTEIRFYTRSGLLTAERCEGRIALNFPVTPVEPIAMPAGLEDALGVKVNFVGKSVFDYLVELENETAVCQLKPDLERLKTYPVRGIIVTSQASTASLDFVSRFFAPQSGINEDPVTGSAHCSLAHYWSRKLNKTEFNAYQASIRGGELLVRLEGERVFILGQAVTTIRGVFC